MRRALDDSKPSASNSGLGVERAVQFITGMANIRDVISFPRTLGSAEF